MNSLTLSIIHSKYCKKDESEKDTSSFIELEEQNTIVQNSAKKIPFKTVGTTKIPNVEIVFCNGMNKKEDQIDEIAKAVSGVGHFEINYVPDVTKGFVSDLLDAAKMIGFSKQNEMSEKVKMTIENLLEKDENTIVKIIAHSKGCPTVQLAAWALNPKYKKRVDLRLFGPPVLIKLDPKDFKKIKVYQSTGEFLPCSTPKIKRRTLIETEKGTNPHAIFLEQDKKKYTAYLLKTHQILNNTFRKQLEKLINK